MEQISELDHECPKCKQKGKVVRLIDRRKNQTAFGSDLVRDCPECKTEFEVISYG